MNGKLVILAGGISSRMKNSQSSFSNLNSKIIFEAESKSKAMISVGFNERPFLDYLLYNAYQVGYRDVVIIIGQKDNSIKDYYDKIENRNQFKEINISYAVQLIPEGRLKPLGTADALLCGLKSRSDWRGETFTVCNSDNLYSERALRLMLHSKCPNALIDYNRDTLGCEKERIEKFAVTKKDDTGYLVDIIEKPSAEEIESVKGKNGFVGVSMNIFSFNYDMFYPFLEIVPLHPLRQEKELPTAIKMMLKKFSKSVFTFELSEEVPDLTNKDDIIKVKSYLEKHFKDVF